MTDLTSERLDKLEAGVAAIATHPGGTHWSIPIADIAALIAQARRAEAVERERDALREHLPHECAMVVDAELARDDPNTELIMVEATSPPAIEHTRTMIADLRAERDALRDELQRIAIEHGDCYDCSAGQEAVQFIAALAELHGWR